MLLLVHEFPHVRARALALFAGKARRAVGLQGEVVILVTSNDEMQQFNRAYRGKNKPTDVLSFPSQSPKMLGDIAVSVEIAADNAADLGHSTETEVKILILHGLLHLAGYDHETDNGKMEARETELRLHLKLPTGLIERAHAKRSATFRQGQKAIRCPQAAGQPEMSLPLFILLLVLLALLALVSYVDRLHAEMGRFLSREFQENIDAYEEFVEPRLHAGRERAALSMAVLTQLSIASIGVLIGYVVFMEKRWVVLDLVQAAVSVVLIVVIFNRLLPYVLFVRTRGQWLKHWVPVLRALIYLSLPATLILGFALSVTSLSKERTNREPEHPSEAVDALIEAGQEEGILEESDRDLIQSVVEFGDKTVREVMTPRPEIVAVPVTTTIAVFTDLVKKHPYSRIPVYEGDIDHIKGIVYAKDLLQVPDVEAHTKTVRDLMKTDVYFVPETKLGSDLLREMQRDNVRLAVVIDEYGGVGGVVTIEDLVEEIVGEIRDEHEKAEVVKESETSYIFNGNTDIDLLEKVLGIRPDEKEATTIAGLVSELAGHIPKAGEVFSENGLRFEVLDSTERRVGRVRVTLEPRQVKAS